MIQWQLPPRFRRFMTNRYALTGIAGLAWVTFVSDISLPFIVCSQWELNEMEDQIRHLHLAITELESQLDEWSHSEDALERYARETYFMKRPEEEVFRIVDAEGNPL